jgi:hypothetical protein
LVTANLSIVNARNGAQIDGNAVYIDAPHLKEIFNILLDNSLYFRHPKLTLYN